MGLATLLLSWQHQNSYDNLILLSGDGDLEDSVAHVKRTYKELNYVFLKGLDLQAYADYIYWI